MSQLGTDITGFLGELLKDRAGNTLAIVAASTIPLLGLIGGGIDISRGYMAKTQLQAACDAGVLAGRRAMAKTGEYTSKERAKADAMFNFNFEKNSLQANKTSFTTNDNDEGQVIGEASTEVQTAVMYVFGKDTMDLAVDCMAELQLANVDVMFVLDSTGSMAGSNIAGLRDAVRDFHATVADAVIDEETRVRYAFVPYSSTVNASQLISRWGMPSEYFVDTAPYQTREAHFNNPVHVGTAGTPLETTEWFGGNAKTPISSTNCTNFGKNTYPSGSGGSPLNLGTAPDNTTKIEYSYGGREGGGTNRPCWRKVKTTTTTYETEYKFTAWRYKKINLDTSSYKLFADVPIASSISSSTSRVPNAGWYNMPQLAALNGTTSISTTNTRWNGCIEERNTVAASSFSPVPDGALDLDLNLEPDSDESRWKPMWSALAFYRDSGVTEGTTGTQHTTASAPCPSPMLLFQEIETNSTAVPDWLDTYLEGLVAVGNTYHDIGMIWGGRLASTKGIFEENVNEGDDNIAVSRHLIFMTDGKMEPNRIRYTAYGTEQNDNRIGPSGFSNSQLATRHTQRFRAVCDAIKAEGYTIYVVSFGTSLTNDLRYCSTGGRAYQSNNTTELRNTFKFIASQVADLRLGR